MFGFRYIKFDPTRHVMVYKGGELRREGPGLAFWYFAPSTTLVAVPLGSSEAHYIFEETTLDYQQVTIQGQVTYRISDPKKAALLLNHTLDARGDRYVSQDPEKIQQRVVTAVNVLAKARVQNLSLRDAMTAGERLVGEIRDELKSHPEVLSLGLEILGLSILAIKPTPDTARALEAGTREQLLKKADDASPAAMPRSSTSAPSRKTSCAPNRRCRKNATRSRRPTRLTASDRRKAAAPSSTSRPRTPAPRPTRGPMPSRRS